MAQPIGDIIRAPAKHVFRRMFIKRVLLTGGYEADWFEISGFVTEWGTIEESYGDNFYTGEYEIPSFQVGFDNTRARFNAETDNNSLFNGFATRVGTRFKIEIGFFDVNQEEVLGRAFFGITYSEPTISGDGNIKFNIASILKVFQLYPATGIAGGNQLTNIHIERLTEKTEGGNRIFDRFFEGATDAERYQIATGLESFVATILEEQTVWDKIIEYSFYENFFPSMTDDGNFQWTDRDATALSQWTFNGAGSFDNIFGINIIEIDQKLGVDRVFSKVTVRFNTNDNDIAVEDTNWTPGDGSVPDLFGERVFEFEATPGEINNPIASSIAARIHSEVSSPHNVYNISTTYIPQLRLNDRVTLNYSGTPLGGDAFILNSSLLSGPDLLGGAVGAINLVNKICKISALKIDNDALTCEFELTEL